MKVHDFIMYHDDMVTYVESKHVLSISDIQSIELALRPIRKKAGATILNATTNVLNSSIGNGNEQMRFQINITTSEGVEELILHEKNFCSR